MDSKDLEVAIKDFYDELTEKKQDYLILFSKLQIQIEGWFRGEVFNYLQGKTIQGTKINMTTENREAKISNDDKRKVDIKIKLNNEWYWIELKHILVGYQKDSPFPLSFYFYKDTYIYSDIKKLTSIDNTDKKQHLYSLVFISTNYLRESDKKSTMDEINSMNDLKEQFTSIITKHKDIRDKILDKMSLVSFDYVNNLHFGYMLLEVKNSKGEL